MITVQIVFLTRSCVQLRAIMEAYKDTHQRTSNIKHYSQTITIITTETKMKTHTHILPTRHPQYLNLQMLVASPVKSVLPQTTALTMRLKEPRWPVSAQTV